MFFTKGLTKPTCCDIMDAAGNTSYRKRRNVLDY